MAEIWRSRVAGRRDLSSEDGGPVTVVYPGRPNDGRGADFRDAVVTLNGVERRGDIEVHVRSGDWQGHGHHLDPAYNRVVLHVVMRHDANTLTQGGEEVPVLEMARFVERRRGDSVIGVPCRRAVARLGEEAVGELLEKAGEERFRGRAARFGSELVGLEDGQPLYAGIMGDLGYSKNKAPFRRLAETLPLRRLNELAGGEKSKEARLAQLQAVLLGTAGFLPSQRGRAPEGIWPGKLERAWELLSMRPMTDAGWEMFRIRPGNSPVRRLVAMSYLLLRFHGQGLLAALRNELERVVPERVSQTLVAVLMVGADGYWAEHLDFGAVGAQAVPALLGRDRAAEIIVNVLLPFAFVWAASEANTVLAEKVFHLYQAYPRLEINAVEKHMRAQMGVDAGLLNSACRQQGLLQTYASRCTRGGCAACPLGDIAG